MEINTTHLYQNNQHRIIDKDLNENKGSENKAKTSDSEFKPHIAENEETKVTLSSQALSMLYIDKSRGNNIQNENTQSDKTHEQKKIEYEVAKKEYQEKVNDLPVDYRKMKVIKDRFDEEIKMLKAEVSKIKQSTTLSDEEMEKQIRALEQQIMVKSLAVLDIGKEFAQRLKEEERSKSISPEKAAERLSIFTSSPPEAPEKNSL